jgi:hypothetical protein
MKLYQVRKLTIILGILATGLSMLPLAMYFLQFHGSLSAEQGKWGEFGSYISGVYGTLAFLVLAYTTNITRRQFQIQNEDNVFFKLHDSLQDRIANSTVIVNDTPYTAHQTLKAIAIKFQEELSLQTVEIARHLLCNAPETISNVHFMKIFEVLNGNQFIDSFTEDKERFIADIKAQRDFNSRWEQLKLSIGSRGAESDRLKEALRATGSVSFYKIPFSERSHYYSLVVQRISDDHGEFLDGYFKNICLLLEFASNAINKDTYISFLKAQLTKYELIILFYLVAGRELDLGGIKKLHDLGIMDELLSISCRSLMLDFPTKEVLQREIDNVFDNRTSRLSNHSIGPT